MLVFRTNEALIAYVSSVKRKGQMIGFVPTMGALHEGHISLVKTALSQTDVVVCSIFVNPTQFNDINDFNHYPITVTADIELLESAGCHALYLPDVSDVYPNGISETKHFNFGNLETILEGAKRPGHFKGVGMVMHQLLNLVQPTDLFMGQKDLQQCVIVQNLLQLMELDNSIQFHMVETKREADGLAMSSRNRRLNDLERAKAIAIYQCLISIKTKKGLAPFDIVQKECFELLEEKGFKVEYVELLDLDKFELNATYDATKNQAALIAAWMGNTRLIDNMIL